MRCQGAARNWLTPDGTCLLEMAAVGSRAPGASLRCWWTPSKNIGAQHAGGPRRAIKPVCRGSNWLTRTCRLPILRCWLQTQSLAQRVLSPMAAMEIQARGGRCQPCPEGSVPDGLSIRCTGEQSHAWLAGPSQLAWGVPARFSPRSDNEYLSQWVD